MEKFWEMLQREDGCLGLPRVLGFVAFCVVMLMLVFELVLNKKCEHLPAAMTFCVSLLTVAAGSKYIDKTKGR